MPNFSRDDKKKKGKKSLLDYVEPKTITYDYPVFCFKYLHPKFNISTCSDKQLLKNFLARLQKLAEIGFKGIISSSKHDYGFEKIPLKKLKITNFPEIIPEDVTKLDIYRASGNNLPFAVYRRPKTNVLHVIAISCKFGSLYNHGSK